MIDFDVLYPSRAWLQVPSKLLTHGTISEQADTYKNMFWYNSPQLVTLPQAIRRWIMSHES